jgi:hypothetical protein
MSFGGLRFRPRQIQVPLFDVPDNPTIRISDIKSKRFYLVDRDQIREKRE